MIVSGTIVTPAQLRVAQQAMSGEFTKDTVFNALCAANVPWSVVGKTTNRLLNKAVESGNVRPLDARRFAKVG